MTRSDLLADLLQCKTSEKCNGEILQIVENFHNMLDKFWLDMILLNDIIQKERETPLPESLKKIFIDMRDKMAQNFGESNRFKTKIEVDNEKV